MRRHFGTACVAALALAGSLALFAGEARAQLASVPGTTQDVLSDPFAFYYAIYLPNQQLQALRPGPLDSVNQAMVTRQYYAQGNRRGLTDPASPFAENYDPLRPYSSQQERMSRPFRFTHSPSNLDGTGPSLYYNRIHEYYPEMASRPGRQKNANVYSGRGRAGGGGRRGGGGGMGGMGGMGGGGMGGGGMGMGGMGGGGMF
jgi:hypothetical protein